MKTLKTLLILPLLAIMVVGGLYLYMNRYEYLRMDGMGSKEAGGIYLRINKLTGHKCILWQGQAILPHTKHQDGFNWTYDDCGI